VDENNPRTAPDAEHGCPGFVTALVLRCGRGDEAALVALMELLYSPVRARLAVALPDAEADELVGLAFIHIWGRAAAYDAPSQAGVIAWLLDEAAFALGLTTPVLAAS